MTAGVGTVAYMPPEVINEFEYDHGDVVLDGPKCDVFSFAVLALYAVTGVSPHEGLNNNEIFAKVGMSAKRTPVPTEYFQADANPELSGSFPKFVALVDQMWAQDPAERPPFAIILAEITDIFTPNPAANPAGDGSEEEDNFFDTESSVELSSDEDSSIDSPMPPPRPMPPMPPTPPPPPKLPPKN